MNGALPSERARRWRWFSGWIWVAAFGSSLLGACAPVPLADGQRRQVVRAIATDVILPTLTDFSGAAAELESRVASLAAEPGRAALSEAQAAWRKARKPWKEAEAFAFGPAADLRLGVMLDQTPVDSAKIDLEIAGSATLDAAYVAKLGANRKGFHALEYLLFGDTAAVLDAITTDANAARRRDFLVALAENLARDAVALQRAWAPEGGKYAELISEPHSSNSKYQTIQAVLDTLVNENVFLSETVADKKLGKPMGTASGGTPAPELQESGPSDNSISDMAGNLRGIRNVYAGTRRATGGLGVGTLVAAQSPATDHAVRQAIASAQSAVNAIPKPYSQALLDQHPSVEDAYAAVKDLKRLLGSEVVAVLGATLKFNNNDGD